MKYLASFIVIILIISVMIIINPQSPNDATELASQDKAPQALLPLSSEEHKTKMHAIINCAALIASSSKKNKIDFEPGSETFQQVSYGLGKAEAHEMDAGLTIGQVKSLYDQKTLSYYVLFTHEPELLKQEYAKKITGCQQQLRLYNPTTQMQAVIEEAKRLNAQ